MTKTAGLRTLDVDGATLRYVIDGSVEGAGKCVPIAFAHAWCSKLEHWSPQAQHLAGRRTVVRWDRRGMGRSISAEPAEGPERHARDLAAILDREGIERVVVAGHAGGGPTAVAFAATCPERTAGLVVVDMQLPRSSASSDVDRVAEGIDRTVDRLCRNDGAAFFERMYRTFFGPRADPAAVDDAVANALATPLAATIAELRQMTQVPLLAGRVTSPLLWVSAQPTDTAAVRAVFAATPEPLVGHVVGSGHFVPLEVPQQLNPMIDLFLDLIDGGASA